MKELVSVMGEQVLGEIISRVKKSKYYSISFDSTPDVAHIDQLALVLRYMEKDGPVERFVYSWQTKAMELKRCSEP